MPCPQGPRQLQQYRTQCSDVMNHCHQTTPACLATLCYRQMCLTVGCPREPCNCRSPQLGASHLQCVFRQRWQLPRLLDTGARQPPSRTAGHSGSSVRRWPPAGPPISTSWLHLRHAPQRMSVVNSIPHAPGGGLVGGRGLGPRSIYCKPVRLDDLIQGILRGALARPRQ